MFILDCCDGSDEWANNVRKGSCQNTCTELYHVAKKKEHRLDNLYALGFEIRAQLIAKGKYLLTQKQVSILTFHIPTYLLYLCKMYLENFVLTLHPF